MIGSILITLKYFPRIEYRTIPIITTDTITIVKFRKIPAVIKDTIIIKTRRLQRAQRDTMYVDTFRTKYAMLDTSLENGNLQLNIKYFIPENFFDLSYKMKHKIIYVDKEIPYNKNWKDNIGISLGWQVGYDFVSRRYYQGVGLNVGYKIK